MKKKLLKFLSNSLCILFIFSFFPVLTDNNILLDASAYNGLEKNYDDYKYIILDDGTIKLTLYSGKESEITVPEMIDGKPVSTLGKWMYLKDEHLVSVTIPDSVTTIEEEALPSSVENIIGGNNVSRIYSGVFTDWYERNSGDEYLYLGHCLLNYNPPDENEDNYDDEDEEPKAPSVYVKPGTTCICCNVFSDAWISEVNLPDGLEVIEADAFSGCSGLKSIHIPSSVIEIGDNAFKDNYDLAEITGMEGLLYLGKNVFSGTEAKKNYSTGIHYLGPIAYGCKYDGDVTDVTIKSGTTMLDSYSIPEGCVNLRLPDSVKVINEDAFKRCRDTLVSISGTENLQVIRDNVFYEMHIKSLALTNIRYIGDGAFAHSDLETVTGMSELEHIGKSAFMSCKIKSIHIPDGVRTIDENAFADCVFLNQVTGMNGVRIIKNSAFEACSSLSSMPEKIPSSLEYIDKLAFDGTALPQDSVWRQQSGDSPDYEYDILSDHVVITRYKGTSANVVIPSELAGKPVTEIGERPFGTSISSITLPEGLKKLGIGVFENQSSLTYVTLPSTLEEIGVDCFRASGIISIDIPAGVSKIEYGAFQDCKSLRNITFHEGLKSIGQIAFINCSALESLELPEGLENFGDGSKSNFRSICQDCTSLKKVTFPDSLKKLPERAFSGCTALETVRLGNTLARIPAEAFMNCSSLRSVNIPRKAQTIEKNAFCSCRSLTEITIMPEVKIIESNAFKNCTSLNKVVLSYGLEEVQDDAFHDTSDGRIWLVFVGTENELKNLNISSKTWSHFRKPVKIIDDRSVFDVSKEESSAAEPEEISSEKTHEDSLVEETQENTEYLEDSQYYPSAHVEKSSDKNQNDPTIWIVIISVISFITLALITTVILILIKKKKTINQISFYQDNFQNGNAPNPYDNLSADENTKFTDDKQ